MADGENVAGKIGLDTTDWKTGISEINRDVRVIESGFKAIAAGMDDWKNSADGLTQRNNALSEIIGKQKEKVALLEGEYYFEYLQEMDWRSMLRLRAAYQACA